jgi:cytochrome c oxidase assembly protein subunit 15
MPSDSVEPFPRMRLLIIACTATFLTFLVILLSGYIRLAESGLGCSPWPECFAHFTTDPQAQGVIIPLEGDHRTLRTLHRLLASFLTILVMIISYIGFRYRAVTRIALRLSAGILIVTVILAVLGINTPDREFPLIAFGNLVGGFVLLCLLYCLTLRLWYENATPDTSAGPTANRAKGLSRITLIAVTVQIISGGWASANYSTAACSGLFNCSKVDYSHLVDGLDLFRQLPLYQPDRMIMDESLPSIMFGHHLVAVFLSMVVSVCLYPLLRQATELRIIAVIMLCFLLLDISVAILGTYLEMPLWTGTTHSLFSILLLLTAFHLAFRVQKGFQWSISPVPGNQLTDLP